MSGAAFSSLVAVLTLAGLAWVLYRPKVQESETYKATVVPLGEIMDVGFIVFSPILILLFGFGPPPHRPGGRARCTRGGAAVAGAPGGRIDVRPACHRQANDMNKTFVLVLGLVAVLYIASAMAVLAAEIDVVRVRRFYPRALLTPFTEDVDLTDGDRRAYAAYAQGLRYKGFEVINVSFDGNHHQQRQSPERAHADAERPTAPPDSSPRS